eukprot:scaffold670387_cov57-Prasinocladus_malaysianus.AAC.1
MTPGNSRNVWTCPLCRKVAEAASPESKHPWMSCKRRIAGASSHHQRRDQDCLLNLLYLH